MYLTHQLIPGPQEQWRHLEKNYLGTLEHIKKKKNPRGSDFFLPSSRHLSGCEGIVDMIPVKTENSSRCLAGWWIPYVTSYLSSLKYLFFQFLRSHSLLRMDLKELFPVEGGQGGLMSWSSFLTLPSLLFSVPLTRECISCFPIFLLTFIKIL